MVRWAFATILGHHVVPDEVVLSHQQAFPSFAALCDGLRDCDEFTANYAARSAQLGTTTIGLAQQKVVASLYRTYRQREPEPRELADTLALLEQMGGLDGVGDLAVVVAQILGNPMGNARVRTALPERPPAPWRFVGREQHIAELLHWFTRGEQSSLFLCGPDGAGRTTLAAEFGRRLAGAGDSVILPGGARLDHVIFVGSEGPDMGGTTAAMRRSARILKLSGWSGERDLPEDDVAIDAKMKAFLAASNGLIILDDQTQASQADEQLLVQVLGSKRHNRLLYTHAPGNGSGLNRTIQVAGFSEDREYEAFLAGCAARFDTPTPAPAEYEAIARWSHGLPHRIETLFEVRRGTESFAQAITQAGGRDPG